MFGCFFFHLLANYTLGHKDFFTYCFKASRKFFKTFMPRQTFKHDVNSKICALQFAWAELNAICSIDIDPYGRKAITRLVNKLPLACLSYMFALEDPKGFEVVSVLLERVNNQIKNGSALTFGLRKFEIFLFHQFKHEQVL